MKVQEQTPFIPDETLRFQWLLDEKLQEAHERLSNQSLDEFWGSMPPRSDPYDRREATYVDLRHPDDPGDKSAIVLPLPFANGWAPHMALRAKLLQDSLPVPKRVIVFPNNTAATKAYHLSVDDIDTVSSGNFDPIAELQLNVLQKLGLESIQFIGYSQGATIGAVALKVAARSDRFELGNSGLFEPPNMIPRTEKELSKAFTGDGLKPLNKAINDSGIPALTEAQRSKGLLNGIKQLGGLALFGLGTLNTENKAIKKGFTSDRFMRTIGHIPASVAILLAGGRNSKIVPIDELELIAQRVGDDILTAKIVDGYGHEAGDNIVVHTLLAKLALKAD